MSSPEGPEAERQSGAVLVGRCYTRARLWPAVVGRMPGPGGGRLWGGPYSRQQLAVLVVMFLVLLYTRVLWARFGLVVNGVVLVGVPYGVAWVVRRVEVSGRSPLAVVGALVGLSTAPRGGRLRGRPVRESRASRVAVGLCTVGGLGMASAPGGVGAVGGSSVAGPVEQGERVPVSAVGSRPSAGVREKQAPLRQRPVVMSGAQALAARAREQRERV